MCVRCGCGMDGWLVLAREGAKREKRRPGLVVEKCLVFDLCWPHVVSGGWG